jgi:protein-L-isoaspartate(D-aspartate) O-methyltransferase
VPQALLEQLAEGGRIAIPVGGHPGQTLRVGTRSSGAISWQESVPCMFVPLVGTGVQN